MIYIGILIGISATLIALQVISVRLNIRDRKHAIDYQRWTLRALEERNEIGEEMVKAILKLTEGTDAIHQKE